MGRWVCLVSAALSLAGGCATEGCPDARVRLLDVVVRLHGPPGGAREIAIEGASVCGPCGCATTDARGRASIDAVDAEDTLLTLARAAFAEGVVTIDADRRGAVSLPLVPEVELARVAASAGLALDPELGHVVLDVVGSSTSTPANLAAGPPRDTGPVRVYTDEGGLADPRRAYLEQGGRVWFFDVAPGSYVVDTDRACELELGGDQGGRAVVDVVAGAVSFVRRTCSEGP